MRIRSTKPEFWRSERVSSVNWDARLVLKGLESYVDDNGVGKDDLALIVADVFPRDLSRNPPGTLQKVSEAIGTLADAGLLWRYEADGTKLLFVAFWESIQRIEKPTKGRFPRPDGTMNYRDSEIREPSRNIPVTLPEGSGLEQGNRGTGEQGNRTSSNRRLDKTTAHPRFPEFWSTYPRREAKQEASKKFTAVTKTGLDPHTLIDAAGRYAAYVAKAGREREKIKLPTTWLNQGCWEDELDSIGPSVVPIGDPNEWLRRMWQDGDVAAIEKATGLSYPDPDLPMDVSTPEEAKKFHLNARRTWITDQRDAILRTLTVEDAA